MATPPLHHRAFGAVLSGLAWLSPPLAGELCFSIMMRPRRKPIPQDELEVLRKAEKLDFAYNGLRLQGYRWGAGQGPKVLVLHGWESHAGRLGPIIQVLAQKGYEVIAYDAPAHGASEGQTINLLQNAEALRQVLQQIGPVYALVAHSFGAGSALWMLGESEMGLEKTVSVAAPENAALLIEVFAKALALSPRAQQAATHTFTVKLNRPPESFAIAPRLSQLRLKGLVLHDRQDELIGPDHAERIARAWPGAQLVFSKGLGHRGILRDPAMQQLIVSFLAKS